jgi:hypothetical protein
MKSLIVTMVLAAASLLIANDAAWAVEIPKSQLAIDLVEVPDVWYEVPIQGGGTQIVHSGQFPQDNFGQTVKVYMSFKNKSSVTLTNVQWRIYKSTGPGQFDSGVQTISSLAPSGGGYSDVYVNWKLAEGSHRFVGVIDPNNQIAESPEMRRNNSRNLDVTVGPLMSWRDIDPREAGAPGTLAVNMQDSNGCRGNFTPDTYGLRVDLFAPYPLPIPFPGCSMKPEFYKGAQLKNGWQIQRGDLKEASGNYPGPPPSTWGWVMSPTVGSDSLYGQAFISIPSRSTPCTGSSPCWSAISVRLTIQIKGPAATNPFPPPVTKPTPLKIQP